jgi:hypothetical protein
MRIEVVQGDEDGRSQLRMETHPAERVGHERVRRHDDVRTVLARLGAEGAGCDDPD